MEVEDTPESAVDRAKNEKSSRSAYTATANARREVEKIIFPVLKRRAFQHSLEAQW